MADDGILGAGDTTHRGGSQTDMEDNLPRVDLGRRRRAFRLAKGSGDACGHMCAMLSSEDCPICDDEVTCWGLNDHGQLGVVGRERTEATSAIPSPTPATRSISAAMFACIKLTDPDSYRDASVAPPRGHVVSRASSSTCVIVDNGGVKCFGKRRQLCIALDDGDTGDEPEELGDALLYAHITTREDVVALAAMHETHCALLEDGDVHCWGRHVDGETGSGHPPDADGYVNCDARTSRVDLGADVRVESMCGGYNHACASSATDASSAGGKTKREARHRESPPVNRRARRRVHGRRPVGCTLGHDARHVAGMRKGANVRDVQRWFCQVLGQTYGPERDARVALLWLVLLLDG